MPPTPTSLLHKRTLSIPLVKLKTVARDRAVMRKQLGLGNASEVWSGQLVMRMLSGALWTVVPRAAGVTAATMASQQVSLGRVSDVLNGRLAMKMLSDAL